MTETVLIERDGRVAIARLNRPQALNALNAAVMKEMGDKLSALDADPDVGCIIVTGSEKAFAAGADIKEMQGKTAGQMFREDFFAGWERFAKVRTPKIAAVSGFALGGGCELALMCDTIFAADTAKFGQPEIKLGVIPGMGGSQRLTRLIGKSKAMDMILTGRMMDAAEAERCGLVSRVVPAAELMAVALAAARTIASYSKPAVQQAREAVDRALEVSLAEGLLYERRVFHALFATDDQKEGMAAFVEKRTPDFKGR
jgi:enoyl-CoA hydratase